MSRWRIAVVAGLLVLPTLVLAAIGSYHLWATGWGFLAWWPLAGCMAVGYLLGWHWQRSRQLIAPLDFSPQKHWTDRDQQAWKLIEARARQAESLDIARLSDVQHYAVLAQELAVEIAKVYYPRSDDPVGNLTVPELLAVAELASHDLAEMVDRYLPGGHLITVNDWKRAKQATEWYQKASNAWWAISALFSPINTGVRYAAAKAGIARPLQMLQQNLLVWFYTAYLHRLGSYLIEMNSGRLRVGVRRYRELMAAGAPPPEDAAAEPIASGISQVTLAVVGQVKAGKSSLINALLGEQRAVADVLPATDGIDRYTVQPSGISSKLVLLDTPGYGHAGPKADQLAATRDAARQSDLLLFVLHAKSPGRQADVDMLGGLRAWFAAHPELKQPSIVAVVTHIDLLSPAMEWSPPYAWRDPKRPKEVNIRDAVAFIREQLGEAIADIVPVCVLPGKVFGIAEELLPAIAARVDTAKGVALLRCLHAEADAGKVRKVFDQLLAVGTEAAKIAWERLAR